MNEITKFTFEITNLQQAMEYSKMIADSELVPKDFKGKAGNVLIAIQMGIEIGLKPMQAIQNISVINGRPCIWGDAMIGLVQNHPLCEYIKEEIKNDTAFCTVKRRGDDQEYTYKFSKTDAKTAGLLNKTGVWQQYPERMLQMRARGFALRDKFSDVLKGIAIREEVMDYQVIDAQDKKTQAQSTINNLIQNKKNIAIEELKGINGNIEIEDISEIMKIISNSNSIEELEKVTDMAKNLNYVNKSKVRKYYKEKLDLIKLYNPETGEISMPSEYEKVKNSILNAKSRDTLDVAADLISTLDEKYREELIEIYHLRKDQVK